MSEDTAEDRNPSLLVILVVLFEAALAPLALLLGWIFNQAALGGFAWREDDVALGLLASAPMIVLFLLGQKWPIGPFRSIKRFFDEEVRPSLATCTWPDLALMSLAAGVGEEMLFRGVFQGLFGRWFGPWAGCGAASLLFGLLHPITPGYIIVAAFMGAFLGGALILSGNLLTVMVAHAVYDFVALAILLREDADHDPS